MIFGWLRRWHVRHTTDRPGPAVTPAQAADLAAAKAAQARVQASVARVQRVQDVGAARWPRVHAVGKALSDIRNENHLAADISTLFRGDR